MLARASASAGVYNKLLESDNIRVSFVLNGAVPDEESYIQKIIEATVGAVFDTPDAEEVKQYILSFLIVNTYKIITANNYEPVALDAVLRRDSQTDTDKDELYDWNEVNTEAIYTVKEKLPENEGGDKELRKKPYLLMTDMPTIQQCITYYGKDHLYVESGFERFKDKHNADKMTVAELEEFLNSYHITPIWSDPTQVDSDGDGGSDFEERKQYETNPLIKNHFSYSKNYLVFNAHNSYEDDNRIITNDVQLIYAALADIAYEKGLRKDYYGDMNIDGYYLVSQLFGESNAHFGSRKGLCGLVDGVDGYPTAEKQLDEWLNSAMKRACINIKWERDIDDPYFGAAIGMIRMTEELDKSGKSKWGFWEDYNNQKARNAARWRKSAESGSISDEDGQYRYYQDDKGTWQALNGTRYVDDVKLDFVED